MTPKQFKKIRLELLFTQKELAKVIGVTPRTIRGYESGSTAVPKPVQLLTKLLSGKVKISDCLLKT